MAPAAGVFALALAGVGVLGIVLAVVLVAFGGDRLGLRQHRGDRAAHDPHAHAVGDLDQHLVVADHLGDRADDAAAGDDAVAAPQRARASCAWSFVLLLLRPDQEEIEDDEDQHERQRTGSSALSRAASDRLRIGRRNEHRSLLSVTGSTEGRPRRAALVLDLPRKSNGGDAPRPARGRLRPRLTASGDA